METEQKQKLSKRIIKEQDVVFLEIYNHFNKSLGILEEYSNGMQYSEVKKFVIENPEIIDELSTKNLYTLLSSITKSDNVGDVIKKINEKIIENMQTEEFFCEDIDSEFFMRTVHTAFSFSKLENNLQCSIKDKVLVLEVWDITQMQ